MNRQLINGKCYGWSSVTIHVPGMESMEPTNITYDDSQETEGIHGKGGTYRGWGTGNITNSVKLEMLREDFDEMCRVMKAGGCKHFYDYIIPKITVSYADEGATTSTDILTNVKFEKRSFKAAQGDKSLTVSLDAKAYGGITINGLDA